ncbi:MULTISPECIES: type II toxin-antitoxin system HicA family toxin [unclassified Methanoculleus]|jgi:predicted RNA binding protein YcfA (HicA-like mRNA interferase family)|uniref:type II toxin-antitoxin system HicA family toxin n=1 Tax=unclassified Methanoculleus TaxID=2619537 RepID=UPI0025EA8C2A|nr:MULTISPECIES: type II toxin-antitoxin system HicA family toxin [unclassified Methanoculleus]MCK9319408.1 type II toxin-antitoxin system HicA family toxin [Methanoculleus sp.]MDD2255246.1 type II toxin-antitoxin system HicA family toxin [Methanoculleus sp.]MDD2788780.1 type II toxin-antitoxin system HicA family toxin [Methanoculleus sp.]MDD3217433.1 type II toxin-antitoxin system HicA family toxin [Methanoculleus sp.]MDD4315478.1 type II toxin-antitoxin system HicA family toxin [Methanoculle
MPRRPVVSGFKLVKFLKSLGYTYIRQTGSHVQMVTRKDDRNFHVVVPLHNELRVGTLYSILDEVSKATGIPRNELIEAIR